MKVKIIVFFTIIFSIVALYLSRNKKDFIYVVPKIKNFEVLNQNLGSYSIKSLDSNIDPKEIGKAKFFNGSIFYNVPNGKYKIKGKYFNSEDSIVLDKEKEWEKVYLNLEGTNFTQKEEKFLIFLTFAMIVFNGILYLKSRKNIPKGHKLRILFYLITIKLFLTLRLYTESNILVFLDFVLTRSILIIMIFYFIEKIAPKNIINKKILYFILLFIYFYNVVIGLIICSPKFLVYLVDEQQKFITFIGIFRKTIDFSRVLFFLVVGTFFHYRKRLKKSNIFSWIVLWTTFFIFEFFREIFPNSENLSYFIEIVEIFVIYWAFIFYNFKVYNRNVLKVILYMITISISYILLFKLKSILESAIILGVVVLLHFYSLIIDKIMYVETKNIDQIYNHLCLVESVDEFQKILENEIKKRVNLSGIYVKILLNRSEFDDYVEQETDLKIIPRNMLKLKEYDYAYKVGFDRNNKIALIFIKENLDGLSLGDQRFLIELLSKISSLINKLRLETLYKELE